MAEFTAQHMTDPEPGFARKRVEEMLSGAGILIDGSRPWDIRVRNEGFFKRVLVNGSLGLGETYMDDWWECDQVDELTNRLLRSDLARNHRFVSHFLSWAQANIFNLQKKSRAFQVGEEHYDTGNDLYQAMLDKRMVYTCGYWLHADNLEDAQRDKLDLVCRKLALEPGMRILDIGCGWGSFARYAAEHYGVEVVGITVSKEQVELGIENCKGLPVEIRLQDYRDVSEKFDAIVSLGMFEHVGHKNYRAYMEVAKNSLRGGARFLLHTIGKNDSRHGVDPWIAKYIFPNGELPSLKQITGALESLMIVEDVHNFGPDYDRTLMAWCDNFNQAWPSLKDNYSDRFFRMWNYYLKICAGAFRARDIQVWQLVLSSGAPKAAYRRPE